MAMGEDPCEECICWEVTHPLARYLEHLSGGWWPATRQRTRGQGGGRGAGKDGLIPFYKSAVRTTGCSLTAFVFATVIAIDMAERGKETATTRTTLMVEKAFHLQYRPNLVAPWCRDERNFGSNGFRNHGREWQPPSGGGSHGESGGDHVKEHSEEMIWRTVAEMGVAKNMKVMVVDQYPMR